MGSKPLKEFFALVLTGLICTSLSAQDRTRADTALLKEHVLALTQTRLPRSYENTDILDEVAQMLVSKLTPYADTVFYQDFKVQGVVYRNVIASFCMEHDERIIIGAHYDVCGAQPGADDNASGVAGLLELARLLGGSKVHHRIDLVAYALEEPPYFRSPAMGSYIHAQSLRKQEVSVMGMISLEMIGFFSKEKRSQHYPLGIMKAVYGNRGDYITLVRKFGEGKFARRFSRCFKDVADIRVKSFKGPSAIPGIDYSDHLNYWNLGFSALMITDTSFYRNPNYHKTTDTIDTLDFSSMARVVDAVLLGLKRL